MLGTLNKKQIVDLLNRQNLGRLGCHVDGETYIVPVNFVYKDDVIYAHSGFGKKIEMMRKNAKVCFQVDEIKDNFEWSSAILWGTFEELEGEVRQQVMQSLIHRIMPKRYRSSQTSSHAIPTELHNDLIVYRIVVDEASGRFESHTDET